jgi:hypothetical protein
MAFAKNLSDYLNSVWDQAWNVVLVQTSARADTVVDGYAFRNHWLWRNGLFKGNQYYSIIIWKDYNCQSWKTLNQDTSLFATPSSFAAIDNGYINQALD